MILDYKYISTGIYTLADTHPVLILFVESALNLEAHKRILPSFPPNFLQLLMIMFVLYCMYFTIIYIYVLNLFRHVMKLFRYFELIFNLHVALF